MESGTTSSALDKLDQTNSIGCLTGDFAVLLLDSETGNVRRFQAFTELPSVFITDLVVLDDAVFVAGTCDGANGTVAGRPVTCDGNGSQAWVRALGPLSTATLTTRWIVNPVVGATGFSSLEGFDTDGVRLLGDVRASSGEQGPITFDVATGAVAAASFPGGSILQVSGATIAAASNFDSGNTVTMDVTLSTETSEVSRIFTAGGSGANASIFSLGLPGDNIVVVGDLNRAGMDLGPITVSAGSTSHGFIAKYDARFRFLWGLQTGDGGCTSAAGGARAALNGDVYTFEQPCGTGQNFLRRRTK